MIELFYDNSNQSYWTGTSSGGELNSNNCNGFSTRAGNVSGQVHLKNRFYFGETNSRSCGNNAYLLCLCY